MGSRTQKHFKSVEPMDWTVRKTSLRTTQNDRDRAVAWSEARAHPVGTGWPKLPSV